MTSEAPADPTMTRREVRQALTALLLAMFVSMIATTVVSTSLPVIVPELGGDQAVYTWVITATLLTTAISTPIWGKLADLLNRKALMQIALIIFVLASATAGLAHDPTMLITSRAVQGIGGGGLAALSQVLMADIISPRERGRYMGLFSAVMAVATVGGPLLGGIITDTIDWRWNFYISVPFAIVALVMLQKTLHIASTQRRKVTIDYLGVVLLSASAALILIWVSSAGNAFAWWSLETVLMVGGAVLAAALFVLVELKSREPLIPLSLFRDRTFTLSVVASVSTGVALFGSSVYLAQYMQLARGATPTEAGLMTVPMIGGMLLTSTVVGALITRYGRWKAWLVTGGLLLVAGTALLSTIHYDTNFVLVSVYMFLLGAGVGMTMQNLVLIVQNTARPEEIGVASSGVSFFRSLAGTAGVAAMGAVLAAVVSQAFIDGADRLGAAIAGLGEAGAEVADYLQSGALPEVRLLPEAVRVIVEDFYAQGVAQAFLIGVPFAVIAVIAIAFLPNIPLGGMTTSQLLASKKSARMKGEAPIAATTTGASLTVPAQKGPSDEPA